MIQGDYIADRDLFLDKDGKMVESDDPAKLTKLVGKGGRLNNADAQKYGLLNKAAEVVTAPQDKPETSETDDEEQAEDTGSEPEDLESMKVADLKTLAEKEEVDLTGITLKADIIAAIEEKRREAAE